MTLGEQDQTSKPVSSFERRNNKSIIKGSYENLAFLKTVSRVSRLALSPGCHGYRREPAMSVFIFTSVLVLH